MKETKETLKITKKQSAEVNEWLDQGREVLIPSVAYIRRSKRGINPHGTPVMKFGIRNLLSKNLPGKGQRNYPKKSK